MRRFVATVTSEGCVTIPAEVRNHLGIDGADDVVFVMDGAGVRLQRARYALADVRHRATLGGTRNHRLRGPD